MSLVWLYVFYVGSSLGLVSSRFRNVLWVVRFYGCWLVGVVWVRCLVVMGGSVRLSWVDVVVVCIVRVGLWVGFMFVVSTILLLCSIRLCSSGCNVG